MSWKERAKPVSTGGSWKDRAKPVQADPSTMEALLRGGAQGLSLGFADELAGAVGALTGDGYTESRDEYRSGDARASEAHPIAYGGAEIASGLVPGVGMVGGATRLARIANAAKTGAVTGLGLSEADLTKGEVGQAALDTAVGGVVGGGVGMVGEAIPALVRKAAGASEVGAERMAVKSLGPTKGDYQRLMNRPGGPDAVGAQLLDEGVIKPFASVEDTAEALAERMQSRGEQIGQVLQAGQDGIVDPIRIAQRFDDEVIAPLLGDPSARDLVAKLQKERDAFLASYAPGYRPGGRAPGTPTTITRHMEFVPQAPVEPPLDVNLQQTTMPRVPGLQRRVRSPKPIPAPEPPTPTVPQSRSTLYPDEIVGYDQFTGAPIFKRKVDPVVAATMESADNSGALAGQLPFQTERGLPVKRLAERRLEGVPMPEPLSVPRAEQLKRNYQKLIPYDTEMRGIHEHMQHLPRIIKEEVETGLDRVAEGGNREFLDAKKAYGALATADEIAQSRVAGNAARLPVGLYDVAAGGLAGGNLKQRVLGALASKTIRARGASTAAVTLDKLSKTLSSAPQRFGRFAGPLKAAAIRGGNSLAATHFVLYQSNPSYRQMLKDQEDAE